MLRYQTPGRSRGERRDELMMRRQHGAHDTGEHVARTMMPGLQVAGEIATADGSWN